MNAYELIKVERDRQRELWGENCDNHTPYEWAAILGQEYGKLCIAIVDTYMDKNINMQTGIARITKEAVHVAAVAVAIIEAAKGE